MLERSNIKLIYKWVPKTKDHFEVDPEKYSKLDVDPISKSFENHFSTTLTWACCANRFPIGDTVVSAFRQMKAERVNSDEVI